MRKRIAVLGFAAAAFGLLALAPAAAEDKKKADQPAADPEIKVPYVPTPQKVVDGMLRLAAVKEGDTVYDLGCGDGRIAISAVKSFKAKKGLGLDFNPERLKDCAASLQKSGLGEDDQKKLTFKQGDVLKMTPADFKDVDVVTLYLLPQVNLRLRPVLQKGLKPGARIVSHAFDMGDWKAEKTEGVKDDDGFERTIYLWTIKRGEGKDDGGAKDSK